MSLYDVINIVQVCFDIKVVIFTSTFLRAVGACYAK